MKNPVTVVHVPSSTPKRRVRLSCEAESWAYRKDIQPLLDELNKLWKIHLSWEEPCSEKT